MMPAPPERLLKFLPDEVEAWKMTRSTAETVYDQWVHSQATRWFERPRPDAEDAPPMVAKLTIEDTGGYAPARALFADFVPEVGEGFEKRLVNGFPTILIDYRASGFSAEILVADRFLVRILCENQPRRFLREWVGHLRLRGLTRLPKTEVVALPEVVTVTRIDELDPSRNRTYELGTASGAIADREGAEDAEATGEATIEGEDP